MAPPPLQQSPPTPLTVKVLPTKWLSVTTKWSVPLFQIAPPPLQHPIAVAVTLSLEKTLRVTVSAPASLRIPAPPKSGPVPVILPPTIVKCEKVAAVEGFTT